MKLVLASLLVSASGAVTPGLLAQAVLWQQPTATYSQPNYSVAGAVDASLATGWGVARLDGTTGAETAVFETVQDVESGPDALLTFRLRSGGFPGANLGRYRLSVTSDDRSQFADGLATGGDVTAAWEVLDPISFYTVGGATLRKLPDSSLLASGANPDFDTNVVVAQSSLPRITGIRIETMLDASLPTGGPGRHANGNSVLYDISLNLASTDLLARITVSSVDIFWPGRTNRMYQVQYSSALTTNLWVNLGSPVQGNGTNRVTDTVQGTATFYRVRYAQ